MNQLFRLPRAKHAGWLAAVVLVNSKTDCSTTRYQSVSGWRPLGPMR